jgi:hypothetical protein
MSSKRVFFIMAGALGLSFALLIGAAVYGDSLLRKKSADLTALKLENRILDEQQKSLIQANKDVQKYTELEKTARAIVPQDKDQAKTVREIIRYADEARVPISSVSFPTSTLGQVVPPAQKDASNTSDQNKTAAPTTPGITQVKPVDGMPGVYQMEIIVQSEVRNPVPYSALIDFLAKLENNRRTAQVSNIAITPFPQNPGALTFNLGINVFIRP